MDTDKFPGHVPASARAATARHFRCEYKQHFALVTGCSDGAFVGVIVLSLRDTSAKEGGQAPRFAISTDEGRKITPDQFGGKLLVLNFWASWCPPCVQEIPSLNAFQKRFAQDRRRGCRHEHR